MPGQEIALPASGGAVTFRATLTSNAPLERFELVSMGEVVQTGTLAPDKQRGTFAKALTVTKSGWYSMRASGANGTFPVENTRPLAVTNPIYVVVGGQPIRDRASAEYFVKWVDTVTKMAAEHPGWRSDKEKAHVLGQFAEARAIFAERARQ